MKIQEKFEMLDKEINEMKIPFDKALPHFQEKLWKIADEYNTTGDEIFIQYINWKKKQ
ncbi:MAG: hypothetical protein FWD48_09940 [Oscillospiraceae bacterium]|nr:hypothetical protein [Oscillospiraceae bacterium]